MRKCKLEGEGLKKNIPLSIPNFEGNERKYVDDAIKEGWVSTGGEYITQFEKSLCNYLHTEAVAACQSGTSGIHLCLIEAGVSRDDVVIVSPLTFIAAVNPIKYQQAIPIFIDCDDSLCIDPNKIRKFCENECSYINGTLRYKENNVKAIIVVHIFGNMADMESIMAIAEEYNLQVIEDATEALGTYYKEGKYKNKFAGTIGDFGVYSFNGNKIITTGGGGAVTAKEVAHVKHMRYLSTQAKTDPIYFIHEEIGYNYRMTNIQAAVGVAQMEMLTEFIRRKHCNYLLYQKDLANLPYGRLLPYRIGTFSNQWFYSLAINRSLIDTPLHIIISELREMGIETRAIWGLICLQKPYLEDTQYMLVKAPYYADCVINLPCSTQITSQEIHYVTSGIKKVLNKYSNTKMDR